MRFLISAIFSFVCLFAHAQSPAPITPSFPDKDFYNAQYNAERVRLSVNKHEADWKKLFEEKKLKWPATNIYLRVFKADQKFEIYARDKAFYTCKNI
jgi:hypothetical protein